MKFIIKKQILIFMSLVILLIPVLAITTDYLEVVGGSFNETCISPDDCYEDVIGYELTDIPETINYRKMVVPLIQEVQNLKQENNLIKNCLASSKDFIEYKNCLS